MSEYLNEVIGHEVGSTAEWRREKANQFPDDLRNVRAAEELERLAREIDALNDSEVERQISDAQESITKVDEDGNLWPGISEVVSEELRSIGFHGSYGTATAFLEWYRDLLSKTLHDFIEEAVPVPDLREQVENDPRVKLAKRAYEAAYAQALAEARKTV
jgi:hypothetical protein